MKKTKIEELYENEKAKGFVNHLIQSYLPIYKVQKVFTFTNKKPIHKCNVCNHQLIDVDTIFHRMKTTEFVKESVKQISQDLKGEDIDYEDRAVVKYLSHGAVQAWNAEKTDTNLCLTCIQDLLAMVQNGLMWDDKNISYQVNKMKRSGMFNMFSESSVLNNNEKEKVQEIQKKIETNKKHVATFGDIEVLQKLKEKMKAEENGDKTS